MRCSICDMFITGGAVQSVCETCQDIIDSNVACMDDGVDLDYSVIPSETDMYGRVLTDGRHPKIEY